MFAAGIDHFLVVSSGLTPYKNPFKNLIMIKNQKFNLPEDYDEKQLIDRLAGQFAIKKAPRVDGKLTLYDTFDWRLWGAREIRELLEEVGFSKTIVHIQTFDEDTDEPLDEFEATDEAEDYATWIGYIVAEK